jgi:allantoinase
MNGYDLVVKNGRVFLPGGVVGDLNVGIKQGRIAVLTTDAISGKEEIDAEGQSVIPGVVDSHTHCWRGSEFETMANAGRAAAKGGVTTIIDMPVDRPIPSTPKILNEKIAEGESGCLVDFALQAGVGLDGLEGFSQILEAPVVGAKLFMDNTPPIGKYRCSDTGEILEALKIIAAADKVACIHCEDTFIIDRLTEEILAKGRRDPLSFAESRPPVSEYAGIERTLALIAHTGCRSVIAHISIPEGIDAVTRLRRQGAPVFAETCPHYLLFTTEDMAKDQRLKYKPPNRDRDRVEALWDRLKQGRLHLVGSDHAPLQKDTTLDIWDISGGVGNMLEVMLPLTATEAVENRGFGLDQIVKTLCENPARIYGLYPRKGCIQPGSDGDLVILNETERSTIDPEQLSMIVPPYSVFEGRRVSMRPDTVIVRGKVVVRNKRIVSDAPWGRFVPAGKYAM